MKSKSKQAQEIAHIIAQFDNCRILKDGGGKITFEFGAESLEAIQMIQTWHNERPCNFALAVKALEE
jgi:hypothetical protein